MRIVKTPLQDDAGMTVAEVIIALGIIMVGLLALIAAMPLSTSQIGEANLKTTATFLAQQRLEQIKNAQWTSATDKLGGNDGSAAVSVAGFADRWPDEDYNSITNYPRFRRQVRIQNCSVAPLCIAGINPPTLLDTMRQVSVTVSFFPMAGTGMQGASEENVQLTTLVSRRP